MRTISDLLPCPFCGGAMQIRFALWASEGDRDAVIHNVPGGTSCPIEGAFSIDTFDEGVSVAEAWNRRTPPSGEAGEVPWPGRKFCEVAERNVTELAKWVKGKDDKEVASDAGLALRTLLAHTALPTIKEPTDGK